MSSVASPKRNLKGAPSQEELSERLRYLIGGSTMPQRQADEDEYEHEHEGFSQQPSAAISKRPIAFRPMHFLVIVLCVALAIGYSIFTAVNGRTQVIPESAEEVFTASTPEPTPVELFRIHVIGAVQKPGVVGVPKGSRVIDAIEAAGGFTSDAASGELNLAAVVYDGAQLVVGGSDGVLSELRSMLVESSGGGSSGKINLNQATASQLESLPGIGVVMATRIIERRSQRPFTRVEELQEIAGIGPKIYAKLAELVQV